MESGWSQAAVGNWRTGLFPGSGGPAAKRAGKVAGERPRNNKSGSTRLVEAPPAARAKAGAVRGKEKGGKPGELELVLRPDGRVVPKPAYGYNSRRLGLVSSARAARSGNKAKTRPARQGPKDRAGSARLVQAEPAPPTAPVAAWRQASTSAVSGNTVSGTPGRTEAPITSWWKAYGGGKGKPGKPAAPAARNNKAPLPAPVIAPVSAGEKRRRAAERASQARAPNAKDGAAQSAALAGGAFLAYALSGTTGVGGVALLAAGALTLQGAGDPDTSPRSNTDYGQSLKSKFWDGDSPTGAAAGKPAAERPKNNKSGSTRLVQKAPPGAKKKAKKKAASGAGGESTLARAGKPAAPRPQNNKAPKAVEKKSPAESDAEREARLEAVLEAVDVPPAEGTAEARQRLEAALGGEAGAGGSGADVDEAKQWLEEALGEEGQQAEKKKSGGFKLPWAKKD